MGLFGGVPSVTPRQPHVAPTTNTYVGFKTSPTCSKLHFEPLSSSPIRQIGESNPTLPCWPNHHFPPWCPIMVVLVQSPRVSSHNKACHSPPPFEGLCLCKHFKHFALVTISLSLVTPYHKSFWVNNFSTFVLSH
jgi:hypothetical protein